MDTPVGHEKSTETRIVVAFEDALRAYRGTLAAAIRILRPDVEVVTVQPKEVGRVAKQIRPDVVIASPLHKADIENVLAWVELSLDPTRSSTINVNGDYSEMINPTLDNLLEIIEQVAPLPLERSPVEQGLSAKAPYRNNSFWPPARGPAEEESV